VIRAARLEASNNRQSRGRVQRATNPPCYFPEAVK